MRNGRLGGDQQIGAPIAEGKLDALIFFVDPLTPMPHDGDVKALKRPAIVYDLRWRSTGRPRKCCFATRRTAEAAVRGRK
jgi:methylglyoxal synthase